MLALQLRQLIRHLIVGLYRYAGTRLKSAMTKIKIQWLCPDENMFEIDWLRYLFDDVQNYIGVEQNWQKIETTENTVLVCNHAVPYRAVLEDLRRRGKKYVIVLLSDENLWEPCEWLHDPACVGLLRNYIHPNQLKHPKVEVFGLGYKKDFLKYLTNSNEERNTTWCFAGTPHGERQRALDLFQKVKSNKIHLCSGFGAADGISTEDYAKMLQNSVFALCPEGQDSMDSFRIYEALEAGCIPITKNFSKQFTIRPSYWHAIFYGVQKLPFISADTYEECFEQMVSMPTEEIRERQKRCVELWKTYKTLWKDKTTAICRRLFD